MNYFCTIAFTTTFIFFTPLYSMNAESHKRKNGNLTQQSTSAQKKLKAAAHVSAKKLTQKSPDKLSQDLSKNLFASINTLNIGFIKIYLARPALDLDIKNFANETPEYLVERRLNDSSISGAQKKTLLEIQDLLRRYREKNFITWLDETLK